VNHLLDISQLEVTYHGVAVAVQGVSISVTDNAIVVLLGRNGAGKTTTLRAATGFLPIDAAAITNGAIRFDGLRIDGRQPHEIARLGMALVPEREKVFRTLTVEENFRIVPMRRPNERADLLAFIRELFPALGRRWRQTAGYLSGGEIQMLATAKCILLQPRLLLPDEVSLGIAPALVESLMQTLARINKETGMAILMAEQNAAVALEIATYAYVMESGTILFEGTPAELKRDQTLRDLYLGLGQGAGTYAEARRHQRRTNR
jgi:branched-chain amino acid transport system ATP-binding protein